MFCKECLEDISPDCVLTNGKCVFCYYKIKEWDSNGQLVKKKDAIITYKNFFKNYVQYYKKLLKNMEIIFNKLPKGAVRKRKIKGHWYYYLAYRKGAKVITDYLGKDRLEKLIENINKRNILKKKIFETKRILYILREVKRPATSFNRYAILERDKFTCQYCGRRAPGVALEVDHIVPLSKGGSDEPSNLVTTCFECNNQKRNKLKLEES